MVKLALDVVFETSDVLTSSSGFVGVPTLEETFALLRTYYKNVQRYRELLATGLTDFEREYLGVRLREAQQAIEMLSHPTLLEAPNAEACAA
jgi:hypothetical protein